MQGPWSLMGSLRDESILVGGELLAVGSLKLVWLAFCEA